MRDVRHDLYRGFNPWDRITEPESISALFSEAGLDAPNVVIERGTHALRSLGDWWAQVLGTDYRGTVDAFDPDERERVRQANLDFVCQAGLTAVEANVLYADAVK